MARDNEARIELTATDKTRAAFNSAKGNLTGLQGAAERLNAKLAVLGVGIGGAGLAAFAKTAIDTADNLAKLSQRVGIGVEQLAGYRLATELSGVSMEQFGAAAGILSQKLASNDKVLQQLGIRADNADAALQQLADIFQRMPDGANKTAIAMRLMGESGARMIPLLNQGGSALREMLAEGRELYPVTEDMARAAEQFNDSLTRLQTRVEGVAIKIAGPLVAALNKAAGEAEDGVRIFGDFGTALKEIGLGISPFQSAGENLKDLNAQLKTTIERREALARISPNLASGLDDDILSLQRRIEFVKTQRSRYLGLPTKDEMRREAIRQRREVDAALKGAPNVSLTEGADAAAKAALKLRVAEQARLFEEAMAIEDYRIEQETARLLEARQDALFDVDQAFALDEEQVAQAEREAATLGRLRDSYIDLIDPIQKYRDQLDEVQRLGELGLLDADQVTEATFAIQEQIDALNTVGEKLKDDKDFAKEFGLTFNSALEDALVNGKKFSDVLKSLEQDIARIIIRKSVTEPLGNAVSGIFNNIFKNVNFGKLFGFATGGQFTVGGSGGTDSQLVAFRATPGEEVTVRTPAQQGSGGGVSIVQHIHIDSRSDRASIVTAMVQAKDAAKSEILASMQRGGTFARAAGRA